MTTSPISFPENELVHARELGQILIFQVPDVTMKTVHDRCKNKTSDGNPLLYRVGWYQNEEFYTNDPVRPGWRLVTHDVIPGSRRKDYLEQTDILCGYLVQVFGTDMPDYAREAIAEFHSAKQELTKLLQKNWQEAARQLVALKVNQLFRESPAETLYSLALYEQVNHERLLPSGTWSWTNRLSSNGRVVFVGYFDEFGVRVPFAYPRYRFAYLGVRFSRGSLE
jgi:hypothetical protein